MKEIPWVHLSCTRNQRSCVCSCNIQEAPGELGPLVAQLRWNRPFVLKNLLFKWSKKLLLKVSWKVIAQILYHESWSSRFNQVSWYYWPNGAVLWLYYTHHIFTLHTKAATSSQQFFFLEHTSMNELVWCRYGPMVNRSKLAAPSFKLSWAQ